MSSGGLSFTPVAAVAVGFLIAIGVALRGGVGGIAGIAVGVVLLTALGKVSWEAFREYRKEFGKRAQEKRDAEEARAKQTAQQSRDRLVGELGAENLARVESAEAAVKRVITSDAARAGWLGDVDFTADIAGITDSFRKSYDLRKAARQLSKLKDPSADDQMIIADARRAAADLAATATNRVELIQKCAAEAEMIDHSLRQERQDARTAEQRAELHAKLSSMLYGIEALPGTHSGDSAADSVIARVQAYREIKSQIQLARGD